MSAFLGGAAFVITYIINMGASVMLPIIIAILSICIGIKPGKAIRSGLMIGVGFVGMGLIVDMMNANMGPAAQAMADRLGTSLSIVEVGWPGMSGTTWGSVVATIAIPLSIVINLIMFALKLTKTINIDIWNVWHMAFTGAIAYAVTGNLAIGILGVAIHAIISFKLGDLWAPLLEDYFELEGLTSPHGTSAYMAPVACFFDWLIEKIPGLKKVNISIVFAGIFQLRPTLACPARWKMTSGCSSFSSPSTASGSSRFTATVFSPGTRSRPVTSYPFAVSSARRYFPTNPSLPVISAFFIISETLNSSFFILHFSFLKLASCLASLRSCSAIIAHSSS